MIATLGRLVAGLVGSVTSACVLVLALWALQSATGAAKVAETSSSTSFSLPKVEAAKTKRQRKKRAKRKASEAKASRPAVTVASGLSGPSFGLASFDVADGVDLGADLVGATDDVVMTESTVDVPPQPSKRASPQYPSRARRDGVEGEVRLSLLIDASGRVTEARVLDSRPAGVFDEAALAAVRTWQFQPARYKGKPVKTWAQQRVAFQLR